jgi:hypothetical protein
MYRVVPVIRGNKKAPLRAGSRARTKTAACGAANRGFESHPARHLYQDLGGSKKLGLLLNHLLHLNCIFAIRVVTVCNSSLEEAIPSVEV